MSPLTRIEARKIIEDIRISKGVFSEESRNKTPADVLEAFKSLKQTIARSTNKLSKDVYSKDSRFTLELIQNADDNAYSIARSNEEAPFIRFTLHQYSLLIDSNEDGFERSHVEAICNVDQSTKKSSSGYIGEKGIGFKSIFKIAKEVKIQSGPFSFRFDSEDPGGLGMLTPIPSDFENLPSDVRTRIRLSPMTLNDFNKRADDLKSIKGSILLFLRNLRRIDIEIHQPRQSQLTSYSYSPSEDGHMGTLFTTTNGKTAPQEFYIARTNVSALPAHELRPQGHSAEIVLTFPVDSGWRPIIERQYCFAFLPMKISGFYFQIQSDFLTQANREDLMHVPWNESLRQGVAATLVDCIKTKFCVDHALDDCWMLFLPDSDIYDEFWSLLVPRIRLLLENEPVLRTFETNSLRTPRQLKLLPDHWKDGDGEPLFRDLEDEVYLSDVYSEDCVKKLRDIGLEPIQDEQIKKLIAFDLADEDSRLRSKEQGSQWHAACATQLIKLCKTENEFMQAQELVPLIDGRFTSVNKGPIYWPTRGDIAVPADLGLRLLDTSATEQTARSNLFKSLGVESCPWEHVERLINLKYNDGKPVSVRQSVTHLTYLFKFTETATDALSLLIPRFDRRARPIYRVYPLRAKDVIVSNIYLPSNDVYSVEQLFKGKTLNAEAGPYILHRYYYDHLPASFDRKAWTSWLRRRAGVLSTPRLLSKNGKLTALFQNILDGMPDKILGVLKSYWTEYEPELMKRRDIADDFSIAKVASSNSTNRSLKESYLPRPELLTEAESFGASDAFAFIDIDLQGKPYVHDEWKFLSIFGAGIKCDLRFYKDILRWISKQEDTSQHSTSTLRVYETIAKKATPADWKDLKSFFEDKVVLAQRPDDELTFVRTSQCVWHTEVPLSDFYTLSDAPFYRHKPDLERFFTSVLDIPSADVSHYVGELHYQQQNEETQEFDIIKALYSCISKEIGGWNAPNVVRQQFEDESLIFCPDDQTWYPPFKCLWTKTGCCYERKAIREVFPDLHEFFVDWLEVQEPTVQTYMEEIQSIIRDNELDADVLTALLIEISSLQPDSDDIPSEFEDLDCFPCRMSDNSQLELRSPSQFYAVPDREDLRNLFAVDIPMLDCSLEQVRKLRSLISALGVEDRYLSRMIHEISAVNNTVRDEQLSRDMKIGSYAFLRCIAHYTEESEADLSHWYQMLSRTTVYTSSNMTKRTQIIFRGIIKATRSTPAQMHLDIKQDSIRIHVPSEPRARRLCYCKQLPEALAKEFHISDPQGIKVMSDLLREASYIHDDILSENGIPPVSSVPESAIEDSTDQQTLAETVAEYDEDGQDVHPNNAMASASEDDGESASEQTDDSVTRVNSPEPSVTRRPAGSPRPLLGIPIRASHFTPTTHDAATPTTSNDATRSTRQDVDPYRTLLNKLIYVVHSHPCTGLVEDWLPSYRPLDTGTSLPNRIFGSMSENKLEHDKRIGAAGELFAFEALKKFFASQNSTFRLNRAHWQSTIRHYANKADGYGDMSQWFGSETADIVAKDIDTTLNPATFRRLGLDTSRAYKSIYFEVKTTLEDCSEPFYMSKAQYRRMKRMCLENDDWAGDIYIICRVFKLGSLGMGMRLIVDPEVKRRRGELEFTPKDYTVKQVT